MCKTILEAAERREREKKLVVSHAKIINYISVWAFQKMANCEYKTLLSSAAVLKTTTILPRTLRSQRLAF